MLIDAALAMLHWFAIGCTAATLFAEWLLLRWQLPLQQPGWLARLDAGYFMAAMAALTTGLLRLFFGGKGASFYTAQPVFWLKVTVFAAIGLLSIAPTRQFIRWRSGAEAVTAENLAKAYRQVSLQLGLLLLLPVCASAMARALFS